MSYNVDAQVFETQIVIENTTQPAGVTSGSIINKGSLSTLDTYVTGHTVINNVKITPNLNDIIYELQATLTNNQQTYVDVTNFYFDDSVCNSFKALINVTVSAGEAKHAVWEINGLYKPTGWVITSSFTGDLTGVQFSMVNKEGGIGQVQYINTNMSGTTIIRYRATTTAPPGSTPLGVSSGVITNTSGPFITNNLVYANTTDTLATTDISYVSNVLKVGGVSRLVGENASSFVNFSNGGAITSMGDASVAKKMIVGQKIGVANTDPSYSLDVSGDINFSGNFYKNGSLYSGSEIWSTNGTSVFYTSGNIGLGTTSPSYTLDVLGTARFTNVISTGLTSASSKITNSNVTTQTVGTQLATNVSATTITAATLLNTNLISTNATAATLNLSTGITAASALLTNVSATTITAATLLNTNLISTNVSTGTLNVSTSLVAIGSSNTVGSIYTTSGNVGVGIVSPVSKFQVHASAHPNITLTTDDIAINSIELDSTNKTGGVKWRVMSTHQSASEGQGKYIIQQASAGLNTFCITSSGNVGIGTINPSYTFDVSGTSRITTSLTTGALYATNSTVTNLVATNASGATLNLSTGITTGVLNTSTANITNLIATTSSFGTVVATTYTGGSMSLSGDLIIGGTLTTVNITTTNVVDTNISSGTLTATNITSTNISSGSLSASGSLSVLASQNTLGNLITNTAGNVGVGIRTPIAPLHIAGTTSAVSSSVAGVFMGVSNTNYAMMQLSSSSGSYIDFARINDDYHGRIMYDIAGDYFDFYTNTAVCSRIDSTGSLTMTGDITAFGNISDARLKENVVNIPLDLALDKVKSLRPVTFTWRDTIQNQAKKGKGDAGFIAQEVEEVVEYAVGEFEDIVSGITYKKLNHERIIPYLVGAIQKLEARIAELEKK